MTPGVQGCRFGWKGDLSLQGKYWPSPYVRIPDVFRSFWLMKDRDHNSRQRLRSALCSQTPSWGNKLIAQDRDLHPLQPHQLQRAVQVNRHWREFPTTGLLWCTEILSFIHQNNLWKCQRRPALSHISPDVALLWRPRDVSASARKQGNVLSPHFPSGVHRQPCPEVGDILVCTIWLGLATAQGSEPRLAGQKHTLAHLSMEHLL